MVGGALASGEVVAPWWQSECGRFTLYCADCLKVLRQPGAPEADKPLFTDAGDAP